MFLSLTAQMSFSPSDVSNVVNTLTCGRALSEEAKEGTIPAE